MSKNILGLGIMSGTSFDGVDYVVCEFKSNTQILFKNHYYTKYPKKLINKIQNVASGKATSIELAQLHFELGRFYSDGLKAFIKNKKLDFIALHGQTVYHAPPHGSLQIGVPHFLKSDFNCPIVYDFRSLDVAQGGQGAPLSPFFHEQLLKQNDKSSFIQNIGGMSNVSYLHKGTLNAFDTGPGNVFIDLFMQEFKSKAFDKHGALASQGIPDYEIIESFYKKQKYFSLKAPKSCGREQFSQSVYKELIKKMKKKKLSQPHQAATLTELTVYCIVKQYEEHIKVQPSQIILCGGGAKNKYIAQRLQYYRPESRVTNTEEAFDWPVTALEAGAFAYLGRLKLLHQNLNLRTVTGGTKATLGSVL